MLVESVFKYRWGGRGRFPRNGAAPTGGCDSGFDDEIG